MLGCRSQEEHSEPSLSQLPPSLNVPRTSEGLLFVWVDADGTFKTTAQIDEIPLGSRQLVRVLLPDGPSGTDDSVFVANLTTNSAELELQSLSRKQWEAQGKDARQARLDALQPKEESKSQELGQKTDVRATVYGASWCKPCHLAEDYLKKKGVQVVKRDIEEDPSAGDEMRSKLRKAGLGGASIPVLDVAGTLLVGFNPSAVDRALAQAKTPR